MSSAQVDAAVVSRLMSDAPLMGMFNGDVFFDLAKQGKTAFILIEVHSGVPEPMFAGDAWATYRYTITAVALNTSGVDVGTADGRIEALFNDTPFPIAGHTWMQSARLDYVRHTILDPENTSIRWQHRGGVYEIRAIPN